MTPDDDMREAAAARFRALVELHRRRRERAARFRAEKNERRRHGLTARHAAKLARIDQEAS